MNAYIKCELCDTALSSEKCIFATYKRVIDGKEHCFCCERHANEYEKKRKIDASSRSKPHSQ